MNASPTVWFDVEDLFHHFRSGVSRLTGIQRLTFEIYRAAASADDHAGGVRFVHHGRTGGPPLVPTTWERIEALHQAAQRASPPPKRGGGRDRRSRSRGLRTSQVSFAAAAQPILAHVALTEVRAIASLGRFGLALSLYQARSLGQVAKRMPLQLANLARLAPASAMRHSSAFSRRSFEAEARPGDVLLTLGSPWFCEDYARIASWARNARRLRFGIFIHDMVPMNHPEWCDMGVVRTFRAWHDSVVPFCDLVLTNSRHTAREVEEWAARTGLRLARPARPMPIGTGFAGEPAGGALPAGLPEARTYVLFVSTLEARKNHALLVRVWRALLDEERSGQRPRDSVPDLVFAGRVGWLVSDLVQQLENAAWLEGRVRLILGPTDAELRALYEGCLFSLFPSWHEGWGLPVTEAQALGVPVLCSSTSALPEAGGTLARYFDPGDTASCRRAVARLLDHPEELAAWRADVRSRFEPTPWSVTARAVLEAAWSLA